ncbi:uncharacterized protein LOC108744477 isoform X2 [Agrilus planipennis]|uniref:Uncharacterized protein LOC108744477 isoform X2 n=1 Tax=Agrilus planipennis TaxID=224129 RepID=A0A1W4XTI5_AGRPL|nr:uncharacterized protein LOC108744477 isoform X2 [Agrilus planipennis]
MYHSTNRVFWFLTLQTFIIIICLAPKLKSHPVGKDNPADFEDDKEEIQKQLIDLLMKWYYDTESEQSPKHHHLRHHHHNPNRNKGKIINDNDEMMMGDQPAIDDDISGKSMQADAAEGTPSSIGVGLAQIDNDDYRTGFDVTKMRDRRDVETYGRDKNERINNIKTTVQQHTGRVNGTKPPGTAEILKLLLNSSKIPMENILGKAASSYPSCEIPKNTDTEAWHDENVINLYFPNDPTRETNASIATAVLKLYRTFSENNSSKISQNDVGCENATPDEERLLRVSVFWYTKSLKKHRVKRRLCDSRVVSESNKWVELNIMHAIRAWSKGRNLGLAVIVEDQEQNVLKASRYYKGVSCTVGDSVPAVANDPIPRHFGRIGRDYSTPAVHDSIPLPPMIQYCLLNNSHNHSVAAHPSEFTLAACKIPKTNKQEYVDRARELEQKLHLVLQNVNKTQSPNPLDPRNGIQDKQMVISYQELRNKLNQISSSNRASSGGLR